MGAVPQNICSTQHIMKAFLFTFLAVLACVSADPTSEAEAEADAKPWVSYPYGVGYPYGYPRVRSFGYRAASPLVYGARPYYSGHYIGKREAEAAPEAEAEAKPWLAYGYGHPLTYGYGAYAPRAYAAYGGYPAHVYSAPSYYSAGHYIGKREAEAAPEAEADPEADPWFAYGHPYAYSGLTYPYRNVLPALKKVEKVDAKPVTYALRPYGAYPYGVNHPLVYSHHVGKREAEATPEANPEAEADPWYTYGYGAYAPRTYAGYAPYNAYSGYHAYPYRTYPFNG